MNNPSLSKIQKVIFHLWDVTSSSIVNIENMNMENDSTIKVSESNTYVTRKMNLTKEKDYFVYFVFDSNNKIVETWGYEQSSR